MKNDEMIQQKQFFKLNLEKFNQISFDDESRWKREREINLKKSTKIKR